MHHQIYIRSIFVCAFILALAIEFRDMCTQFSRISSNYPISGLLIFFFSNFDLVFLYTPMCSRADASDEALYSVCENKKKKLGEREAMKKSDRTGCTDRKLSELQAFLLLVRNERI